MSQEVKIGLVGAGAIAQAYVSAIQAEDGMSLVGVADARSEAAEATAEVAGCPSYPNHGELAEKSGADAFLVCTPPITHEEICVELLSRGKSVLCEKPLSVSSESATRMFEAADKGGAVLTMASKFRFSKDVVKAKSLVTSGVLGDLVLFENAFTARVDMTSRWNSDKEVAGGGVLIDNGTHSVDLMRYFLGPLTRVLAVEGRRVQDIEVEDTVQLFVRNAEGVMATVDLSWSLNKEKDTYVDVYGSQGLIKVGWQQSRFRQMTSQDWVHFGDGYNKVDCFRGQMRNFTAAVRGDEAPRLGPEDAMASVHVVEAAYRSLQEGSWVEVPA